MSKSETVLLRIGDEIIFYDQNNNKLIAENPLDTRACVRPSSIHYHSSDVAMGTSIFRIEPHQSHIAQKDLELFLSEDGRDRETIGCQGTLEELKELERLELKATKEISQNETERKRLLGKPVLYGQVIQLFNQHFKKYLTVTGKTTRQVSDHHHHLLQVNLSSESIGYFRIMPRYRIRFVGDTIAVNETIAVQCVRPEGYLNVDYGVTVDQRKLHHAYFDVYSHTRISSWTIKLHYSSVADQDTKNVKYTKSGQYVRFYHKEVESYLEAPTTVQGNQQVVLKKHIINPLDPKETDSPLAFWEIENVDISRGSKVRWKKSIRIRHVASRTYLSINPSHVHIDNTTGKTTFTLTLLKNPAYTMDSNQDTTLFQLIPVSPPSITGIPYGSFVRIQHIMTGCWMHSENGEEEDRISFSDNTLSTSIPVIHPQSPFVPTTRRENIPRLAIFQQDERHHSRYSSFSTLVEDEDMVMEDVSDAQYRITASKELYYHDCFSITNVDQELSDTFNVANEMVPYLQWYLYQDRHVVGNDTYPIPYSEYESIVNILKALINFCTASRENDIAKRKGIPNEYHQVLLRELGIIEAVIQMIMVPFDLKFRKQVRRQLNKCNKYATSVKSSTNEPEVAVTTMSDELRAIVTLSYHLLRLFLVERSPFEEPSSIVKENRQYVVSVAGESGFEIFKQHVKCDVGATDVLMKLIAGEKEHLSLPFIDRMVLVAIEETKVIVDAMMMMQVKRDEDKQRVSCFRLLCALTRHNGRRYVAEKLFDVKGENCLLQMRIFEDRQVQVKLNQDASWHPLLEVLDLPRGLMFIDYILKLMYRISHVDTVELITRCIDPQVCFYCLKSTKLSSKIRSRFCDLLRVVYVDVPDFKKIALSDFTIDFGRLPMMDIKYPSGSVAVYSEFFKKVMRWILKFLDTRHHDFVEDVDQVRFLSCVLRLVHTKLKLGFFVERRDIDLLFRALVNVLDGRTDARNKLHLEYMMNEGTPRLWHERYTLTEENQRVMNTKVQILNIFDLIFDLRLSVRVNYVANQWYTSIRNKEGLQSFDLSSLLNTFQETEIRYHEHSLIPILKDILKYQYAPLKQIAVVVMHRLFNNSQELFENLSKVVVIDSTQTKHSLVYQNIIDGLEKLKRFIYLDMTYLSNDLSQIQQLLQSLKPLLMGQLSSEDKKVLLEDPSLFCRIFKGLDGSGIMVQLLQSLLNIPVQYYHVSVETIQICLEVLHIVTTNDKEFQSQFVLGNLDLLINITLLSSKLAIGFARLFSNNLYISTHIKEEDLIRIVSTSEGYQANYLLALHELLKSQGKLIKRNQDSVMRFIMENRSEYIPFNNTRMLESLHKMDEDAVAYCVQLISVLALCGQGENTFGQSFARTIFSIGDIYEIMQDKQVSISLKSVMLKFLASIYIEDVELPLDIPMYDSHNVLQLIMILESAMMQCVYDQDLDKTYQDYVYFGIAAFLRSVFEYHISIETTVCEPNKAELYTRLVDLMLQLLPRTYGDEKALQSVLSCLDSMMNVAGFRGTMEPNSLRDLVKESTARLDSLYEKSHHHETRVSNTVSEEIVVPLKDQLNVKFQTFFYKIQMNQDLSEYQKIEFEKLCSHFSLNFEGGRDSIQSLISYLDTMATTKVDTRVEYYQVASIRLLEDIAMQYIRERMNADTKQYDALELKKIEAQNILNDLGCTLVVQNLLSSPRTKIFDAALKLLISLLDGGNKHVQDKLEEYFYSIREERFFYSFHQRLQEGINASKEAQICLTRKMYKMNRQQYMLDNIILSEETNHHQKRKAQSNRRSKSIMVNSNKDNTTFSDKRTNQVLMMSNNSRPVTYQTTKPQLPLPAVVGSAEIYQEISQLMIINHEPTPEFGNTVKDYKVMEDTMRTLQLMVEGHNLSLQTYLAKQPDNIKSFNIVLDVVEYFHAIVPLCNTNNIQLIIQVLDTMTELAQGCLENQVTIFNNKVINPVNLILRESYPDCSPEDVTELKSKVVICLLSLLEGGIENSETIFREMKDSLDLTTVKSNMEAIYKENKGRLENVFEKLECGFLYCILVMTLTPALSPEQCTMFLDQNEAFKYFQSHTGQIEIIMNYGEKQLTRVLFPIPEICQYLRDETKSRFLWNVKRESPSAKIEDFVQQSDMIIYEIENQAHVAHSKYLSFLTEYSSFWWESAYGISILMNMMLMVYPNLLIHDEDPMQLVIKVVQYLLGFIHLLLWILLTAEFYFIQLPVLTNRRLEGNTKRIFNSTWWSSIWIWTTVTETRLLYHVLMVLFSVAGCLVNPGFYSIHLLDFVFRDSILQGVISSITLNIHSISRTAILGIIVIYIHSIIAYMYFRKEFDDSKGLFCGSLLECFVTVLSHGVRSGGGIGDILEPDELHKPSGWRTIFEMSFYLVVVVFLLNAIFGIIFDTFGHLRDERSSIQQDMHNSCFICSIPAVEFQRHAKKGFEDHVKHDHNIWQYLFFLVHLRNKDPTEYTGPESYVSGCLKDVDYSFFPINRALGLDKEQDGTERLDKLEELNQSLVEKIQKLEDHLEKLNEYQTRSRQNSLLLSPM